MKLYLITAKFMQEVDRHSGFVIRAASESEARKLAEKEANINNKEIWLDTKESDCIEIFIAGDSEIIFSEYLLP